MIFATTGTQLPFPRLIAALDALAPDLGERIVAQIGPDPGRYPNLETHATLSPAQFDALFAEARIVVAHAGIGSILSARRHGKPIVLMPRRFDQGEHRNDHQLATVRELEHRAGLSIAWAPEDLRTLLAAPATRTEAAPDGPSESLTRLRDHLRDLIDSV